MTMIGNYLRCSIFLGALFFIGCSGMQTPSSPPTAYSSSDQYITYPVASDSANQPADPPTTQTPAVISAPPANHFDTSPTADVWVYLADNIKLNRLRANNYKRILNRYTGNQAFFDRIGRNASSYLHYVVQEVQKRNMPLMIALLPIVESDFNPYALSHAGAAGAWQIIPPTGRLLGIEQNWWFDGRLDIVAATDGALTYLQSMYQRFGDWQLALAAYNCGPSCVSKAIQYNKKRRRSTRFEHLRLPRETREYVPKLYAISQIIKDPARYDVSLPPIMDKATFSIIPIAHQVSFLDVADSLGLDVQVLYDLNTGYKRWLTHPHRNKYLLVPTESKIAAKQILARRTSDIIWQRYLVKQNQSLEYISLKNGLPLSKILQVHDLHAQEKLKENKVILVPVSVSDSAAFKRIFERSIRYFERRTNKQHHKVRPGESLWSIAQQHGISMKKLMRLNNLTKRSYIHPGDRIKLYAKKGFRYARFTPLYARELTRISQLDTPR